MVRHCINILHLSDLSIISSLFFSPTIIFATHVLFQKTLVEEKLDEIKQLREEHLSKFNMVKDKLAQELDLEVMMNGL